MKGKMGIWGSRGGGKTKREERGVEERGLQSFEKIQQCVFELQCEN